MESETIANTHNPEMNIFQHSIWKTIVRNLRRVFNFSAEQHIRNKTKLLLIKVQETYQIDFFWGVEMKTNKLI